METLTPSTSHTTDFNTFIAKLANKFEALQIFNFSQSSFTQNDQSCFKKGTLLHHCNYCLLLITDNTTQIDDEVQDFANTHYQHGTFTIICHSQQFIQDAIVNNNPFFMTIYAKAELLYRQNGILAFPTFILNRATQQLTQDSEQRFQIAEGFYLGASDCLCNWAQYSVCVFMLHHAVEQLCIGLIEVCLGYRAEFGNLNRLLNLCCCFSHEPLQLFTAIPH